jgi:hypothetical protein
VKYLFQVEHWWILWGVCAPFLIVFGWLMGLLINPYVMFLCEFLPSALFGLWVHDAYHFKKNSLKFVVLSGVIALSIFIFGFHATWITPIIVLMVGGGLKFGKDTFLWSFGSMMVYGILGLIPLGILIGLSPIKVQELQTIGYVISSMVSLFLAAYGLKGVIFGAILSFFARRTLKHYM